MAKVMAALTMSLDGFIAGANDGIDNPLGDGGMRLFDWYFTGDTPIRVYEAAAHRGVRVPPFKLSSVSAGVFEELLDGSGAAVSGRRTYDIAHGWGGNGPQPGIPVFVVTHDIPKVIPRGESDYTFVTTCVEDAIVQAKEVAGEKYVSLMGASVPQQCLRAGLLDEIQIHLVPVLLGSGIRLFGDPDAAKIELEATRVVAAPGVTHLRYRVVK